MGLNDGYKGPLDRRGDKKYAGLDKQTKIDLAKQGLIASDIHALQECGCHDITPQRNALAERLALRYPKQVIGAYRQRVETVGPDGIEILELSVERDSLAFRCLSQPCALADYALENLNANPLVVIGGSERSELLLESIAHLHQVSQDKGIENLTISNIRHPLQTADGQVLQPLYAMTGFVHQGIPVGGPKLTSELFRVPKTLSNEERKDLYIFYVKKLLKSLSYAKSNRKVTLIDIPKVAAPDNSPTHQAFTDPELSGIPDAKNFIGYSATTTTYFFANGEGPQKEKNVEYVRMLMQDDLFLQRCWAIAKAWTDNDVRKPAADYSRVLLSLGERQTDNAGDPKKAHDLVIGRFIEHWKQKQA